MESLMKITSVTGHTAAGGTVILGLTANEVAALGGLAVTAIAFAANFVLNFWFKHQHLKLERRRMELEHRTEAVCESCTKARTQ